MDAGKMMMQKRIDNLQQHIDRLHGALNESERKNAKLTVELEAVKRQRDALLWDMQIAAIKTLCPICKRHNLDDCFEWRGLCKENGGIES